MMDVEALIKTIHPKDGDLVVLNCQKLDAATKKALTDGLRSLIDSLQVRASFLLLPPGWSLDDMTEESMLTAGWQRAPVEPDVEVQA